MGAEWLDNKLYGVATDAGNCPQDGQTRNKIRYQRFNTTNYSTTGATIETDSSFGCHEPGDPTDISYNYDWPTIAVTPGADAIIPMNRFRDDDYPQIAATSYDNGSLVRADSRVILTSNLTYLDASALAANQPAAWADTTGACVDDTSLDTDSNRGVWVAHQFTNQNPVDRNWSVRVAKIQGVAHPDLAPGIPSPPLNPSKGLQYSATATLENRGDGAISITTTGQLKLSLDSYITPSDTTVGTFIVPSVAANSFYATGLIRFTVPCGWPSGPSYVGEILDVNNDVAEYDEGNNGSGYRASSALPVLINVVGTASCP
jgi:hypothetical protein